MSTPDLFNWLPTLQSCTLLLSGSVNLNDLISKLLNAEITLHEFLTTLTKTTQKIPKISPHILDYILYSLSHHFLYNFNLDISSNITTTLRALNYEHPQISLEKSLNHSEERQNYSIAALPHYLSRVAYYLHHFALELQSIARHRQIVQETPQQDPQQLMYFLQHSQQTTQLIHDCIISYFTTPLSDPNTSPQAYLQSIMNLEGKVLPQVIPSCDEKGPFWGTQNNLLFINSIYLPHRLAQYEQNEAARKHNYEYELQQSILNYEERLQAVKTHNVLLIEQFQRDHLTFQQNLQQKLLLDPNFLQNPLNESQYTPPQQPLPVPLPQYIPPALYQPEEPFWKDPEKAKMIAAAVDIPTKSCVIPPYFEEKLKKIVAKMKNQNQNQNDNIGEKNRQKDDISDEKNDFLCDNIKYRFQSSLLTLPQRPIGANDDEINPDGTVKREIVSGLYEKIEPQNEHIFPDKIQNLDEYDDEIDEIEFSKANLDFVPFFFKKPFSQTSILIQIATNPSITHTIQSLYEKPSESLVKLYSNHNERLLDIKFVLERFFNVKKYILDLIHLELSQIKHKINNDINGINQNDIIFDQNGTIKTTQKGTPQPLTLPTTPAEILSTITFNNLDLHDIVTELGLIFYPVTQILVLFHIDRSQIWFRLRQDEFLLTIGYTSETLYNVDMLTRHVLDSLPLEWYQSDGLSKKLLIFFTFFLDTIEDLTVNARDSYNESVAQLKVYLEHVDYQKKARGWFQDCKDSQKYQNFYHFLLLNDIFDRQSDNVRVINIDGVEETTVIYDKNEQDQYNTQIGTENGDFVRNSLTTKISNSPLQQHESKSQIVSTLFNQLSITNDDNNNNNLLNGPQLIPTSTLTANYQPVSTILENNPLTEPDVTKPWSKSSAHISSVPILQFAKEKVAIETVVQNDPVLQTSNNQINILNDDQIGVKLSQLVNSNNTNLSIVKRYDHKNINNGIENLKNEQDSKSDSENTTITTILNTINAINEETLESQSLHDSITNPLNHNDQLRLQSQKNLQTCNLPCNQTLFNATSPQELSQILSAYPLLQYNNQVITELTQALHEALATGQPSGHIEAQLLLFVRKLVFSPKSTPFLELLHELSACLTRHQWNCLIRLLHLYNVGIILKNELFSLVREILLVPQLYARFCVSLGHNDYYEPMLMQTFHRQVQSGKYTLDFNSYSNRLILAVQSGLQGGNFCGKRYAADCDNFNQFWKKNSIYYFHINFNKNAEKLYLNNKRRQFVQLHHQNYNEYSLINLIKLVYNLAHEISIQKIDPKNNNTQNDQQKSQTKNQNVKIPQNISNFIPNLLFIKLVSDQLQFTPVSVPTVTFIPFGPSPPTSPQSPPEADTTQRNLKNQQQQHNKNVLMIRSNGMSLSLKSYLSRQEVHLLHNYHNSNQLPDFLEFQNAENIDSQPSQQYSLTKTNTLTQNDFINSMEYKLSHSYRLILSKDEKILNPNRFIGSDLLDFYNYLRCIDVQNESIRITPSYFILPQYLDYPTQSSYDYIQKLELEGLVKEENDFEQIELKKWYQEKYNKLLNLYKNFQHFQHSQHFQNVNIKNQPKNSSQKMSHYSSPGLTTLLSANSTNNLPRSPIELRADPTVIFASKIGNGYPYSLLDVLSDVYISSEPTEEEMVKLRLYEASDEYRGGGMKSFKFSVEELDEKMDKNDQNNSMSNGSTPKTSFLQSPSNDIDSKLIQIDPENDQNFDKLNNKSTFFNPILSSNSQNDSKLTFSKSFKTYSIVSNIIRQSYNPRHSPLDTTRHFIQDLQHYLDTTLQQFQSLSKYLKKLHTSLSFYLTTNQLLCPLLEQIPQRYIALIHTLYPHGDLELFTQLYQTPCATIPILITRIEHFIVQYSQLKSSLLFIWAKIHALAPVQMFYDLHQTAPAAGTNPSSLSLGFNLNFHTADTIGTKPLRMQERFYRLPRSIGTGLVDMWRSLSAGAEKESFFSNKDDTQLHSYCVETVPKSHKIAFNMQYHQTLLEEGKSDENNGEIKKIGKNAVRKNSNSIVSFNHNDGVIENDSDNPIVDLLDAGVINAESEDKPHLCFCDPQREYIGSFRYHHWLKSNKKGNKKGNQKSKKSNKKLQSASISTIIEKFDIDQYYSQIKSSQITITDSSSNNDDMKMDQNDQNVDKNPSLVQVVQKLNKNIWFHKLKVPLLELTPEEYMALQRLCQLAGLDLTQLSYLLPSGCTFHHNLYTLNNISTKDNTFCDNFSQKNEKNDLLGTIFSATGKIDQQSVSINIQNTNLPTLADMDQQPSLFAQFIVQQLKLKQEQKMYQIFKEKNEQNLQQPNTELQQIQNVINEIQDQDGNQQNNQQNNQHDNTNNQIHRKQTTFSLPSDLIKKSSQFEPISNIYQLQSDRYHLLSQSITFEPICNDTDLGINSTKITGNPNPIFLTSTSANSLSPSHLHDNNNPRTVMEHLGISVTNYNPNSIIPTYATETPLISSSVASFQHGIHPTRVEYKCNCCSGYIRCPQHYQLRYKSKTSSVVHLFILSFIGHQIMSFPICSDGMLQSSLEYIVLVIWKQHIGLPDDLIKTGLKLIDSILLQWDTRFKYDTALYTALLQTTHLRSNGLLLSGAQNDESKLDNLNNTKLIQGNSVIFDSQYFYDYDEFFLPEILPHNLNLQIKNSLQFPPNLFTQNYEPFLKSAIHNRATQHVRRGTNSNYNPLIHNPYPRSIRGIDYDPNSSIFGPNFAQIISQNRNNPQSLSPSTSIPNSSSTSSQLSSSHLSNVLVNQINTQLRTNTKFIDKFNNLHNSPTAFPFYHLQGQYYQPSIHQSIGKQTAVVEEIYEDGPSFGMYTNHSINAYINTLGYFDQQSRIDPFMIYQAGLDLSKFGKCYDKRGQNLDRKVDRKVDHKLDQKMVENNNFEYENFGTGLHGIMSEVIPQLYQSNESMAIIISKYGIKPETIMSYTSNTLVLEKTTEKSEKSEKSEKLNPQEYNIIGLPSFIHGHPCPQISLVNSNIQSNATCGGSNTAHNPSPQNPPLKKSSQFEFNISLTSTPDKAPPKSSAAQTDFTTLFPMLVSQSIYCSLYIYLQLYERIFPIVVSQSAYHEPTPIFTNEDDIEGENKASDVDIISHINTTPKYNSSTHLQSFEWLVYQLLHNKIPSLLFEYECTLLFGTIFQPIFYNFQHLCIQFSKQIYNIISNNTGLKSIALYDFFILSTQLKHLRTHNMTSIHNNTLFKQNEQMQMQGNRTADTQFDLHNPDQNNNLHISNCNSSYLLQQYSTLCFYELKEDHLIKIVTFPHSQITSIGYVDNTVYRLCDGLNLPALHYQAMYQTVFSDKDFTWVVYKQIYQNFLKNLKLSAENQFKMLQNTPNVNSNVTIDGQLPSYSYAVRFKRSGVNGDDNMGQNNQNNQNNGKNGPNMSASNLKKLKDAQATLNSLFEHYHNIIGQGNNGYQHFLNQFNPIDSQELVFKNRIIVFNKPFSQLVPPVNTLNIPPGGPLIGSAKPIRSMNNSGDLQHFGVNSNDEMGHQNDQQLVQFCLENIFDETNNAENNAPQQNQNFINVRPMLHSGVENFQKLSKYRKDYDYSVNGPNSWNTDINLDQSSQNNQQKHLNADKYYINTPEELETIAIMSYLDSLYNAQSIQSVIVDKTAQSTKQSKHTVCQSPGTVINTNGDEQLSDKLIYSVQYVQLPYLKRNIAATMKKMVSKAISDPLCCTVGHDNTVFTHHVHRPRSTLQFLQQTANENDELQSKPNEYRNEMSFHRLIPFEEQRKYLQKLKKNQQVNHFGYYMNEVSDEDNNNINNVTNMQSSQTVDSTPTTGKKRKSQSQDVQISQPTQNKRQLCEIPVTGPYEDEKSIHNFKRQRANNTHIGPRHVLRQVDANYFVQDTNRPTSAPFPTIIPYDTLTPSELVQLRKTNGDVVQIDGLVRDDKVQKGANLEPIFVQKLLFRKKNNGEEILTKSRQNQRTQLWYDNIVKLCGKVYQRNAQRGGFSQDMLANASQEFYSNWHAQKFAPQTFVQNGTGGTGTPNGTSSVQQGGGME